MNIVGYHPRQVLVNNESLMRGARRWTYNDDDDDDDDDVLYSVHFFPVLYTFPILSLKTISILKN